MLNSINNLFAAGSGYSYTTTYSGFDGEAVLALIAGLGVFFVVVLAIAALESIFIYWIVAYQYNVALLQGKALGAPRVFLTPFIVGLVASVSCGIAPIIYALVKRADITKARLDVQAAFKGAGFAPAAPFAAAPAPTGPVTATISAPAPVDAPVDAPAAPAPAPVDAPVDPYQA